MADLSLPTLLDGFRADLAATLARLRQGQPGAEAAVGLSDDLDRLLIGLSGRAPELTLVAVGGTGRRERAPGSDVDLLILCDDVLDAAPQRLTHPLYDLNLAVGLAVRTVDDCLNLLPTGDTDSWAALLEARYLAGPRERFDRLIDRMTGVISATDPTDFLRAILSGRRERHSRFDRADPTEPNLKSGPGGLRDLHTLIWCCRAADPGTLDWCPETTGTRSLLDRLHRAGHLSAAELKGLTDSLKALLGMRLALHDLAPAAGDTLTRAAQPLVAARLGYGAADADGVEALMRVYWRHARRVARLSRNLLARFEERVARRDHPGERRPVDDVFILDSGFLALRFAPTASDDPMPLLFRAARHQARLGVPLSSALIGQIGPIADRVSESVRQDPDLAADFSAILVGPHVGLALRTLDDLGVLGRYLPTFGALAAFYQPNPYHRFTADEHTLRVVEALAGFAGDDGRLGDIARNLVEPAVVRLAGLLHDVGKAVDVARHEIVGAELARVDAARLGLEPEAVDAVRLLVAAHLEMNRVAFRRDLHDPQTVADFIRELPSQAALDGLLLLTAADLMSVAPDVWTSWKASLLLELYDRATDGLAARSAGQSVEALHGDRTARAVSAAAAALAAELPHAAVVDHLTGPWPTDSGAYVATFPAAEIAGHMADIERLRSGGDFAWRVRPRPTHTELTVLAPDRPHLLEAICGALAAADLNVHEARIFTRGDIAIDRFGLTDGRHPGQSPRPEQLVQAEADLRAVLSGATDVAALLDRQRRRYRRRSVPAPAADGWAEVRFETRVRHTIVDVIAPDSAGLLYRLARALGGLGLNVHGARIATRLSGVLDAFDVAGPLDKPLSTAEQGTVRACLLAAISPVTEHPA